MKTNLCKLWAVCLLPVFFLSCNRRQPDTGSWQVIPQPREVMERIDAAPFVLKASTVIAYPPENSGMERTAHFLAGYIREATGLQLATTTDAPDDNCISLELSSSVSHPEGYELDATHKRIVLKGSTEAGVFYGVQTICKALPVSQGADRVALPAVTMADSPRFGYRAFLVDVSRHFFSVSYLKEIIDMLALHNINVFHWHLTDDQGWRIEIKKYPRLTEVGACRRGTVVEPGSELCDSVPVRGFYTQDEVREVIRYAADRFITVVPEIDMPGHMMAALAAYPELGCTGGPYEVPVRFGVFEDVLCGGSEEAVQFAKDVLNEVMNLFPSEYVHVGGDECPKVRWEKCPKCQAKIRELGMEDTPEYTKENQLQAYFLGELEDEIKARGRKMLAWDELLDGNPDRSTMITAWTSPEATTRSARLGHQTVVCPITYLYLSNPRNNRLKGAESVGRVYNFEPVPAGLSADEQRNVVGVQGCIWTEWTKDSLKMEWQMMPRIAALSELQWAAPSGKDFDRFLERLPRLLRLYTLRGYHYRQDIDSLYTATSRPSVEQ